MSRISANLLPLLTFPFVLPALIQSASAATYTSLQAEYVTNAIFTFNTSDTQYNSTSVGAQRNLSVPRFNNDWGTLTSVELDSTSISWSANLTNVSFEDNRDYDYHTRGNFSVSIGNSNAVGGASTTDFDYGQPGDTFTISGHSDGRGAPKILTGSEISYFRGTAKLDLVASAGISYLNPGNYAYPIDFNSGVVSGNHIVRYNYEVEDKLNLLLDTGNNGPLSDHLKSVSYTQTSYGQRIAVTDEIFGEVTVIRGGGQREPVSELTEFYKGDVIETGEDGAISIKFEDATTFALSEDARMSVGEFVYDSEDTGSSFFQLLKGAFIYTSLKIGKDDPGNVSIETPAGALGIRGDAGDYITPIDGDVIQDYNGVEYATLNLAAMPTMGSPVSLYTAVDVPDNPFGFQFSYGFLDASQSIDVFIGDILLYAADASSDHDLGHIYDVELNIEQDLILNLDNAILKFLFDGDHDTSMIIDNIVFGDLQNGDFSNLAAGWFSEGAGSVGFAVLEATPVPLPAGFLLFVSAIGCLGWMRSGRREE